ncbi:hypothetical protein ACIMQW_001696 [Campylobacter jejuni]
MKELTKEQRQIIENKIKQEVENFNTFLDRQYCIDKIYKTIINRIKSVRGILKRTCNYP